MYESRAFARCFSIFLYCSQHISHPQRLQSGLCCFLQRDFFLTRIFLVSFWQQRGQGWRAVHPRFPKQLSCGWDSFLVRLQQEKRVQPHIATLNAALWSLLLSIFRRLLNYCVPGCHHLAGLYVYVVLAILWVSELEAMMCMTKRTTICTNKKFVKPHLNDSVSENWNVSHADA